MAATCVFTDGMTADHGSATGFWRVMADLSPEQRRMVLKFVTGTDGRCSSVSGGGAWLGFASFWVNTVVEVHLEGE